MKNDYFSADYWGALANPDLIHMHNWCGYTREELLSAAKRIKADLLGGRQKSNLSGCLPFLQVYVSDACYDSISTKLLIMMITR